MHPIAHSQLPARLQATIPPTYPVWRHRARKASLPGGTQYVARGPVYSTVYRYKRGQWVATRCY